MTVKDFITEAEGVYGRYTPTQRKYVAYWLRQFSEKMIGMIFQEVLRSLSQTLRMPPGVKEIEDAVRGVRKERALELQEKPQVFLPSERLPEEQVRGFFDRLKEIAREKNVRRNQGSHFLDRGAGQG